MTSIRAHGRRLAVGAFAVAATVLLAACGPAVKQPTSIAEAKTIAAETTAHGYRLGPGDSIDVRFFYAPDLNTSVVVRPDGRISLPLVDELPVAGRTVADVTAELRERYAGELRRPEVSLIVKSFTSHRYFVGGEVEAPTSFEAAGAVTVLQSLAEAGGLKPTARTDEVAVIRRLPERDAVVIPVNLELALDGSDTSQDIVLQPQDVVYVPRSDVAEVNRIVDQYIRQNIPISVGLGIPVF